MTRNFVAIDLGAESGRAVVGKFDAQQFSLEQVHRFPNRPVRVAGHLHWDALRLFDEIQTGIRLAAKQCGALTSVGVDTWGVDFGLLDKNGTLIANPYHYRDHRTDGVMGQVFERVPRAEYREAARMIVAAVERTLLAELAGADGIIAHLREDRRHVQDRDVRLLRETVQTKLNLEMAATDEMQRIALQVKPNIATLVPEKREMLETLVRYHLLLVRTARLEDLKSPGVIQSG